MSLSLSFFLLLITTSEAVIDDNNDLNDNQQQLVAAKTTQQEQLDHVIDSNSQQQQQKQPSPTTTTKIEVHQIVDDEVDVDEKKPSPVSTNDLKNNDPPSSSSAMLSLNAWKSKVLEATPPLPAVVVSSPTTQTTTTTIENNNYTEVEQRNNSVTDGSRQNKLDPTINHTTTTQSQPTNTTNSTTSEDFLSVSETKELVIEETLEDDDNNDSNNVKQQQKLSSSSSSASILPPSPPTVMMMNEASTTTTPETTTNIDENVEQTQSCFSSTSTTTTTISDEIDDADVAKAFNYAAIDCGAKVLAANAEASDTSSVLDSSPDQYMLNLCSAKEKWMDVELCEEIRIVAVTLQNSEFFASLLKDVELLVSQAYPTNEWHSIANLTMLPTRDRQFFRIETINSNSQHNHQQHQHQPPSPLANSFLLTSGTTSTTTSSSSPSSPSSSSSSSSKFLRLRFKSHYGDETYCPLTRLTVHGITLSHALNEHLQSDSIEVNEITSRIRSLSANNNPSVVIDDQIRTNDLKLGAVRSTLPSSSSSHTSIAKSTTSTSCKVAPISSRPIWDDNSNGVANGQFSSSELEDCNETVTSSSSSSKSSSSSSSTSSNTGQSTATKKSTSTPPLPPFNSVGSSNGFVKRSQESVFLALASRIKSVEINLSLLERYVEQLSDRYVDERAQFIAVSASVKQHDLSSIQNTRLCEKKIADATTQLRADLDSLKSQFDQSSQARIRELCACALICIVMSIFIALCVSSITNSNFSTKLGSTTIATNINDERSPSTPISSPLLTSSKKSTTTSTVTFDTPSMGSIKRSVSVYEPSSSSSSKMMSMSSKTPSPPPSSSHTPLSSSSHRATSKSFVSTAEFSSEKKRNRSTTANSTTLSKSADRTRSLPHHQQPKTTTSSTTSSSSSQSEFEILVEGDEL